MCIGLLDGSRIEMKCPQFSMIERVKPNNSKIPWNPSEILFCTLFIGEFSWKHLSWDYMVIVRISYNEDSNVIVMITGSASQLRGSEFLYNRQLFPGYRPIGLSRNLACSRIINEQKVIKLSDNSMGS